MNVKFVSCTLYPCRFIFLIIMFLKVGFFGYVAFYESGIRGDILANFSSGLLADTIKAGRL